VDGETLYYMNNLDLLKPFKLSYKNQLMFLKEQEKLFSSKTNPEQTISPPTPNDPIPLIIDETHQDIHEDNNAPIDIIVDSSVITTTISMEKLHDEKSFPDPYVLPSLPNAVINAIQSKQMEKFEKLCNFRSIVIDAVFYDLKTSYNLL